MSSRVSGAILALTAAALLAVSIATSAWWSGHPEINGTASPRRTVHLGLIRAQGCFSDDDVDSRCSSLEVGGGFTVTRYVELAAVGALMLGLLGLGITALKDHDRRRMFSKIALGAAGASAIVAIALIVQGPDIRNGGKSVPMAIPIGYGMILFFAGTGLGIVAGILAPQAARPKPAPAWTPHVPSRPTPQPPPPVDVLALLQEDALRPSALGPEPMMGRQPPPPSPGGMLAGPSGPLAPVAGYQSQQHPSQPLFSTAPQLRPLYEAAPDQGGTGGYVPGMTARPVLPNRGPTPIAHLAVNPGGNGGNPAPPPIAPPLIAPSRIAPPPTTPPRLAFTPQPPSPEPAARSKTLPPPVRNKPLSVAPAFPAQAGRPVSRTTPPPRGVGAAAVPAPSVPQTLAGFLPPIAPIPPLPARADTDTVEGLETVEHVRGSLDGGFDAAATVARDARDARDDARDARDSGDQPAASDSTDVNAMPYSTGDSTSPSVELDQRSFESSTYSAEAGPVQDDDAGREVDRDDDDDDSLDDQVATRAREKIELGNAETDMVPTMGRRLAEPPAAIPLPPRLAPAPAPERESEPEPPTMPAVRSRVSGQLPKAKLPISTASASLPPPTAQQTATTGPSPACPQCEAPMAWVEEHLRFYCKSCRMYF
jgi:hypothetical protein